ncbi:hypothetical protein BDW72DRAFT_186828 [Aspergillus terricola var. indicus]
MAKTVDCERVLVYFFIPERWLLGMIRRGRLLAKNAVTEDCAGRVYSRRCSMTTPEIRVNASTGGSRDCRSCSMLGSGELASDGSHSLLLPRPRFNKDIQSNQSEQGNANQKIVDTDDIIAGISVIVERVSLGCQALQPRLKYLLCDLMI